MLDAYLADIDFVCICVCDSEYQICQRNSARPEANLCQEKELGRTCFPSLVIEVAYHVCLLDCLS
jgi:hypothetical protein